MGAVSLLLALALAPQVPKVEVALLPEFDALTASKPFDVVIRLRVEEPWHVYWINPGDSGVPTTVRWTLPEGWEAGPLRFPTPQRFESSSGVAYGHKGEVLLLTTLTPKAKALGDVKLEADVSWLACDEACVPGSAKVTAHLSMGGKQRETHRKVLALAKRAQPTKRIDLRAEKTGKGMVLTIPGHHKSGYFFAEDGDAVSSSQPQPNQRRNGALEISLSPSEFAKEAPKRLHGVLVLTNADGTTISTNVDVPLEGASH